MARGGGPQKLKYKVDYPRQAFVACSEGGFTDPKLAKLFQVSRSTIKLWKKDYPEFLTAVRDGKDIWDALTVEQEILKRCKSSFYNETVKEYDPIKKELKIVKVTRKKVHGDVKAQTFWLRNRNRERWPDIKVSEGSLKVDTKKDMPDMPEDMTVQDAEEIYRDIIGG